MIGVFSRALSKTARAISKIAPKTSSIAPETLEEALLAADMAYGEVEALLERLVTPITPDRLKFALLELLPFYEPLSAADEIRGKKPFVELVIGINGAGKTTTIAKLAKLYKNAGQSVILGAGDTFRAAASEQLKIWADKLGVPIVSSKSGGDPSAIAFDTISSAKAKNLDRAIIDTAGRLHTQKNLTEELKKIDRVCSKALEGAPHRKSLIIDGTQGRSAINQAREFHASVGIDAIIVTKLDGTAKGGAIYSISRELNAPILYLGVGEREDDLSPFDAKVFTDSFAEPFFGAG